LFQNSPAKDAGSTSNIAPTDQRGVARPVTGRADIGAFESNISFSTSATGSGGQGTLPNGQTNQNYSVTFTASRLSNLIEFFDEANTEAMNFAPFVYTIAAGILPPGLNLNPNTGVLSGVPTQAGNYTFTVLASDTDGVAGLQSYNLQIVSPTAAGVSVSGRVFTADGRGISGAIVTMTDAGGSIRATRANAFGFYSFQAVQSGETYVFSVSAKQFLFSQASQVRSIDDETVDLNFIADN
jgi:hypothetical protein